MTEHNSESAQPTAQSSHQQDVAPSARADRTYRSPPPPGEGRLRSRRWLIVLGLIALIVVPIGIYAAPGEYIRWQAAATLELHLNGHHDQAIQHLEEIVREHPDPSLMATLIQWLADAGRAEEALAWCDLWDQQGVELPNLRARRYALTALGHYSHALDVHMAIRERLSDRELGSLTQRNHLAYYQALAQRDLDNAHNEINNVLMFLDRNAALEMNLIVPVRSRAALFAAILLNSARQPDAAIEVLSEQIQTLYGELEKSTDDLAPVAAWHLRHDTLDAAGGLRRLSRVRQVKEEIDDSLAALLTMRAYLYQELGDARNSVLDRRRVEWLDYDPEDVLARFPAPAVAAELAAEMAMYLDTRGCVFLAKQDWSEALADLDAAIIVCEALLTLPWQHRIPRQIIITDARVLRDAFDHQMRKALASILYHRMWYYQAVDDHAQVHQHKERIRQLGFEPGPTLF